MEYYTDEELQRYFSDTLLKILKAKKIYQKELADQIGVSNVSISKYVNGRMFPTYCTLYNLALVLDCPIKTFFPPKKSSQKKHSL